MVKHRALLCGFIKGRVFSSCPLPFEPQRFLSSSDSHKDYCYTLAEQLINRGLLSSAQKVIQRLISQCSSAQEAISAADFAVTKGMELDLVTFGCLIRKLVISGETSVAEALYMNRVVGKGLAPGRELLNSMIICYCKLGMLDEARSCFNRINVLRHLPWVGSCNALVKGFCEKDRLLEGYDCFCEITENSDLVLEFACYNRLVDGLCCRGLLEEGLHVFDVMVSHGLKPTIHVCKSLIINFCKGGRVEEAGILCTEIENYGFVADEFMYTYLINSYCKGRKLKKAMALFMRMLKMGYKLDRYIYNTLIHGFANLGLFPQAQALRNQMVEFGLKPDLVTYQVLLDKYCKDKRVDSARNLLDCMLRDNIIPNVHCYTVLVSVLCEEQKSDEVYRLCRKMIDSGVIPDPVLFFILVKNHPRGDELYVALTILETIAKSCCDIDVSAVSGPTGNESISDLMTQIDYLLDEIVGSSLASADIAFSIYMIALCMSGKLNAAQKCMEKMSTLNILPKVTAFNSLIKLLIQKGRLEDVDHLLEVMQDNGLIPDQLTFSIIVNELCKRGDYSSAIDVFNQIEDRGIKPNIAIYDSIINCLGRNKMIHDAERLYYRMLENGIDPDQTMFVTMINTYGTNGWAIEAQRLFEKMTENGIRPNPHVYTSLISGLVKRNMIEKGCVYLDRMLQEGLMPNVFFYTALIKQFLRKRDIEFSFKLIDLMEKSEIELDYVTYITLFSGICWNVRCFDRSWSISYDKSNVGKEEMFRLLHQKTLVPVGKKLKLLISAQSDMIIFALKQIRKKLKVTSVAPDVYLHNGMISWYCWSQNIQEAYKHLDLMQSEGVQPNQVTFTILIDQHLKSGEIDCAVALFNKVIENGLSPDRKLFNTLISGLSKAGMVKDALCVSYMMQKRGLFPSKSSYVELITSLCKYNSSVYVLEIFEEMISHDYVPSRSNLDWLKRNLLKNNMVDEAHAVYKMVLGKRNCKKIARHVRHSQMVKC